jgi:hypothetical protein
MNQDKTSALYDFLYVDKDKISSFYSQIFGGTIEKIVTRNERSSNVTSDLGVTSHLTASRSKQESGLTGSEVLKTPHDTIINDVLFFLKENGYIESNPDNFVHNKLCLVSGELYFIDNSIIEMMIDNVSNFKDYIPKDDKFNLRQIDSMAKTMKKMISHKPFQPTFVLTNEFGDYCGTYKDNYLHEPLMSFFLKHGLRGLDQIHVVGLYEESVYHNNLNDFLVGADAFASALGSLIFPPTRQIIYPLAIFRDIS